MRTSATAQISGQLSGERAPARTRALEPSDLLLTLRDSEARVEMRQPPTAEAERLKPLWHLVAPSPGPEVAVTSLASAPRVVRLTVESDAPGWNPHWARWSYSVRRLTEDEGGRTLAAQDMLAADQSALTLLVRGGERREATLDFDALLDAANRPGDYPFRVVAWERAGTEDDAPEEASAVATGLLCLRLPPCRLLNSLPAVYSEGAEDTPYALLHYDESPFFERFLRGFEDTLDEMREKLRHLERFFDAEETPADFLPWLATWVALTLNANWPEMKRRLLIKEAVWLYRWRGTRRGLSRYLEIYADVVPEIRDTPFSGMVLGPKAVLGRATTLGGVAPHTFTVTLSVPDTAQVDPEIVDAIIEAQRPAHTTYYLRIVANVQPSVSNED